MTASRNQCLSNVENRQGVVRCPNHRAPGADYCPACLTRAADQFVKVIAEAKARHPSAAPRSAVRFAECCPRCISPDHTLRECPV